MATLKDLAKMAGVNKSTVSRALSGKGGISEIKREEILKLADKLGYIPNETAKVLAGEKAKTIGIIVPEIDCNYYASVVGSIESKLKSRGYSLVIGQTGFSYENELHYLRLFSGKNLDGIIFDLYNREEFIKQYDSIKSTLKVPIVFIGCSSKLPDYNVIEIDNNYGVELAIKNLISLGHKRIGFISEHLSSKVRLPAFEAALEKYNIPLNRNFIKIGKERLEEGGYLRMKELLEESEPVTAVFASYDTMAQGALKAIYEKGLKVPENFSIIGFDNIREAAYFSVPLTTVAPPVMEMGEMAVNILLDKIEDSKNSFTQHISLKPRLVVRSSASYC